MAVEVLDAIIEMIKPLSPKEKAKLKEILALDEKQHQPPPEQIAESTKNLDLKAEDKELRRRQIEWLKLNRRRFAGQYVALVGDHLAGHGATMREAREQARRNNYENPFITKIFAEETILSAGL